MAVSSLVLAYLGREGARKQELLIPFRDLEDVEARLRGEREELASTRDAVADARQLLERADATRESLRLAETKLDLLQPQLDEKDRQLALIKSELADTMGRLGQEVEKLTAAQRSVAEAEGRQTALQQEVVSLKGRSAELTERAQAASAELGRLRTEAASAEARHRALQERVATLEGEAATLEAKVAELASQRSALTAETAGLERAAHSLKDQVERLGRELDEARRRAQAELERLESEASRQRAEIDAGVADARKLAEQRIALLQDHMERVDERWKESLEAWESNQQASLEQWRQSQEALQLQLKEQWDALRQHIEAAVDTINKTWDRMRPPEAAKDDEKLAALWEPVFQRDEFADSQAQADEIHHLERARAYLSDLGLVYPDRVINAFHTCLKTNEMSLLTVLAGISGTGKSELPRRYAEAMGLHFLNVAVQPRWDSPQDLFGFYNYMESSYRATELARVLVQMERLNCDAYPPEVVGLSDRMVIVLFDEMNLARVEYYFSEFLSKLEVRRGIDVRVESQRRPAEVAFEAGTRRPGDETIRIFPSGNVLFVGTMNEDETTQALSDKVIDRANVLRFGKPRNLATAATGDARAVRAGSALSFADWEQWIKPGGSALPHSDRDRLVGWTQRVNDALGRLRRPFGHRVNLAIEHYIANYPSRGDERLRFGFSDQLEQRIMPKLRGVDCHDGAASAALEDIRGVIAEVADAPLLEAFNKASGEDLFLWQGVERDE